MFEIKAEPREILGKKVRSQRAAGVLPAVLYGRGFKSLSLSVEAKAFNRLFKQVGETTILNLVVGGEKHNVLIHELAQHPVSGEIIHVDFFEVRMDEKIKTKVPLVFVGESGAVKAEGGILVHPLKEIEIETLPKDLPKEITVDISVLATFEDRIIVAGLVVPPGVKILAASEETVAFVTPPRSDKEMEELEAKPPAEAVGEIKVVGEEEKAAAAAEATAVPEKEK